MNEVPRTTGLTRFLGRPTQPLRVLSIDGGGIRGVIPALVLADIERRVGKPISEIFDLIVGTSIGGLIGLALVTPDAEGKPRYSARTLSRLIEKNADRVFERSLWHKVTAVGNLADSKYPEEGFNRVLAEMFGEVKLSEALTSVMVTSYEIERRIPFFFRSRNARLRDGYDFPMAQVVRATTAAPTYFEPAHVPSEDGHDYFALVDGAVFAYNPALCALIEAQEIAAGNREIFMVSLGAGELTRRLPYEECRNWGATTWAQPLFSLMCDGVAHSVDHQIRHILQQGANGRPNYFRFQVRLDVGNDDMDDTSRSNVRVLKLLAEDMILKNRQTLKELSGYLLEWSRAA